MIHLMKSFLGIHGSHVNVTAVCLCAAATDLQRRRFLALALGTDDKIRLNTPCQVLLSTFTFVPLTVYFLSPSTPPFLSACVPLHLPYSLPVYLPTYSFPKTPLPFCLSPSVFFYPSPLSQSVGLFLCPIHPSTYLSLFPICLFHHLSPPNSSELAPCRELCLARVNGAAAAVAVNTSQCFCSALCLLPPP